MSTNNWYDHPKYYDIAFQAYTSTEADFIEAVCRKYCAFKVKSLLEPACGGGRLVVELARRRYDMYGFDQSQPALHYLRSKLSKLGLHASTFEADMSRFHLTRGCVVDSAYCLVNSFRHLLMEETAYAHLQRVTLCIPPGGIYLLGMSLIADNQQALRWTERRGKEEVTTDQRVLQTKRRIEDVQVRLTGHKDRLLLEDNFQLRTYTLRQFRRLLASVPSLELCDVYDFKYDIDHPVDLGSIDYGLFVLRRKVLERRKNNGKPISRSNGARCTETNRSSQTSTALGGSKSPPRRDK